MKLRVLLSSFAATLVLSGYPVDKPIQAQPPVLVTQSIWKQFTSVEGRFSVLMPGTPKRYTQPKNTAIGQINIQLFTVERQQEAVAYIVAYYDIPNTSVQKINPQAIFDAERDGIVRTAKGKLLSQQNIRLNGFPGREFELVTSQGLISKGRMFLVNRRLYDVIVVTKQQKQRYLTRSIEGFFNSFKLI